MAKTVIGVFESRDQAEKAIDQLRDSGFDKNEISILTKGKAQDLSIEGGEDVDTGTATGGTTAGGILGGIAGLALGAGALAIPGLGPIMAAGPIVGLLSGAATGGIAGGLIDLGIPEDRGRYYEGEVRKGGVLAAIRSNEQKIQSAADIMRENGAKDVETH